MKKLITGIIAVVLLLSVTPVTSVETGTGIGLDITTEEFPPLIWMCDQRRVVEDCVEAGRKTDCDQTLDERTQNYAFEGEQIEWDVLVMDKNKIEQITDVVATIGSSVGTGNDIEVECARVQGRERIPASCNARILEEDLTGSQFDPDTQAFYKCVFTVETPNSMYGEHFLTVEVISTDGEAIMDENEFWFFNPLIGLVIDGTMSFDDVRPGTVSYSETLVITNDADPGSGVLLDMFISGTDFYDPASSGAKCPESNRLKLSHDKRSQASLGPGLATNPNHGANGRPNNVCQAGTGGLTSVDNNDHLCYFASNGAYDTFNGDGIQDNADAEGYRPIVYSDSFTRDFYNDAEIIANDAISFGGGETYDGGNVLAPGADIAMTFKLGLPEPCVGDFSDGSIFFWGEAI